jgi:UPF0755 protein
MKKFCTKKHLGFVVVAILVLAFVLACLETWLFSPVARQAFEVEFSIARGESLTAIAQGLKEKELIRSPFGFQLLVFLSGRAKKIQAGQHLLSPSMSTLEIIASLNKGRADRKVTIIEGWRAEQIGEYLAEEGFRINPAEFGREVNRLGLEGRLFPDTYYLPVEATAEQVLAIFEKNFQKKVLDPLKDEIAQSSLSLNEILIFASIVEREARGEEAQAMAAGILIKRWQNSWPLQADATIQYALASRNSKLSVNNANWWPKSLTKIDLAINSPYNSYTNRGLPPGPICNPGLGAIKAVLSPKDSAYWFYLTDPEGQMHYARTDEEQARNIRKYLR